jgi:hypothetical protein
VDAHATTLQNTHGRAWTLNPSLNTFGRACNHTAVEELRENRFKESTAGEKYTEEEREGYAGTLHGFFRQKRQAPNTVTMVKRSAKKVPPPAV